MTFSFKSRKLWFGLGALALVVIGVSLFSGGAEATYVTEPAKKQDIRRTVEVTGGVRSVTELALSVASSGPVAALPVRVGQQVKAGDVLLSLDAAEEEAAYEAAKADLALKNAGATEEDIALKQAVVEGAQAGYNGAQEDLSAKEEVTAAQVADAELQLAEAEAERDEQLLRVSEDVATDARAAIVGIRNALSEADEVLGRENNLFSLDFRDYLGAGNPGALVKAQAAYDQAADARDAADALVLTVGGDVTADEAAALSLTLSDAFLKTSTALTYTAQVLDGTAVDTREFGLADLVALKSSVAQARTTLSTNEATWRASLQDFTTTTRTAVSAVTSAEHNVTTVRANANATLSAARTAVSARAADLAQAQADLDRTLARPRSVDTAALEANVAAALARLNATRIVAPLAGRITDIAVDRGEMATAAQPIITLMATADAFEITVDVAESDIASVAPGMPAEVTFDAFGDDRVFAGSVVSVDPASKTIEGVVFYEATILLNDGQDLSELKPGLSADVTIVSATRTATLTVPQRAVLERDNGEKYVRVMTGESAYEERTVTAGLRADDGITEITSGIAEGDTILLTIREAK